MTLQLNGLTHNAGNGLDVMLVAPNGAAFVPMSDTGGALSASNINLTLTDAAGASLPQSGALSTGSFKPANYAPPSDSDLFPPPCPCIAAERRSDRIRDVCERIRRRDPERRMAVVPQ